MNFTEFGLAQIKTPAFLQIYSQIPQDDFFAGVFLALVACAEEGTGVLGGSSDHEIEEFVDSHEEQLRDMQRQIQRSITATGRQFRPAW